MGSSGESTAAATADTAEGAGRHTPSDKPDAPPDIAPGDVEETKRPQQRFSIKAHAPLESSPARQPDELDSNRTVSVHVIELPPEALNWGQETQEPHIGDELVFDLLPNLTYEFRVTKVSIRTQPRTVTVLGTITAFNQEAYPPFSGDVIMTLEEHHLLLQITDRINRLSYNVYRDNRAGASANRYIVQVVKPREANPSLTPDIPSNM